MRIRQWILGLLISLAVVLGSARHVLPAESADLAFPSVIVSGFEAYKADGSDAAIKAWLKGSALEGDKNALAQGSTFKQIETYYGKFRTAHHLGTYDISPTTQVIYAGLDYDKGPLFMKFITYRMGESVTIVTFKVNTDPDQILMTGLMNKAK